MDDLGGFPLMQAIDLAIVGLYVLATIVIGLVESFGSFYYSALKDAIVFAAIIPIVLWRWFYVSAHDADENEEE